MTPKTTTAIIRKLEKIKAKVGKDRDELRELYDEVQQLETDCAEAYESLEYAADALSRLL